MGCSSTSSSSTSTSTSTCSTYTCHSSTYLFSRRIQGRGIRQWSSDWRRGRWSSRCRCSWGCCLRVQEEICSGVSWLRRGNRTHQSNRRRSSDGHLALPLLDPCHGPKALPSEKRKGEHQT